MTIQKKWWKNMKQRKDGLQCDTISWSPIFYCKYIYKLGWAKPHSRYPLRFPMNLRKMWYSILDILRSSSVVCIASNFKFWFVKEINLGPLGLSLKVEEDKISVYWDIPL